MSQPYSQPVQFINWIDGIKDQLQPPVSNKLMHGAGQLKVMIVGGPNRREDFHINEGEEFFYMIKGDMQLDIIERGQKREIPIREGEMFLLNGRIPHSPQRFANTVGLVIERERLEDETDGMRWYVPGSTEVLFEQWFHCFDLGAQLKPVIEAYFASEAYQTKVPQQVFGPPPVVLDEESSPADPVCFDDWLEARPAGIHTLYDAEFCVGVFSGGATDLHTQPGEAWFYQIRGDASVMVRKHENDSDEGEKELRLVEGDSLLLPAGSTFRTEHPEETACLMVTNRTVVPSCRKSQPESEEL